MWRHDACVLEMPIGARLPWAGQAWQLSETGRQIPAA